MAFEKYFILDGEKVLFAFKFEYDPDEVRYVISYRSRNELKRYSMRANANGKWKFNPKTEETRMLNLEDDFAKAIDLHSA